MIWNKERRIAHFSHELKKDLYNYMRDDFLNKFYEINPIYDEEIREIFEEAIYEMKFDAFKEIYEMCKLIGFANVIPLICNNIKIMMSIKNPTYPGVYEIDEDTFKTFDMNKNEEE